MFTFDHNRPIYMQIVDDITRRIITRELKSGDKLESVRELARYYSVNPNTIQNSTNHLIQLGLIESVRGMGNIVGDHRLIKEYSNHLAKKEMNEFIRQMKIHQMTKNDVIEWIKGGWDNED